MRDFTFVLDGAMFPDLAHTLVKVKGSQGVVTLWKAGNASGRPSSMNADDVDPEVLWNAITSGVGHVYDGAGRLVTLEIGATDADGRPRVQESTSAFEAVKE